jgi:hypothetical protein
MTCPDIDLLLSATAREVSRSHIETCSACAAIASLAEVRQERLDGHEDTCVQAEVWIALWHTGEIDEDSRIELMAHLESCPACNDAAVRVHAMPQLGEEATGEHAVPARVSVRHQTRPAVRVGAWAALGAAAAMSLGGAVAWQLRGAEDAPSVRASEEPARVAVPLDTGAATNPEPGDTVPDQQPPVEVTPFPVATKGYVTLMCIPKCTVREDGRRIGTSPIVRHETTPGQHRYDLENAGEKRSLVLRVVAGQTTARRISLEPSELINPFDDAPKTGEEGYFSVICVPGCDQVFIDGKNAGPSPLVRRALSSGAHIVRYERGSISKMQQIQIVAGQTTLRRVSMTATPPPPPTNPKRDTVVDPWQ